MPTNTNTSEKLYNESRFYFLQNEVSEMQKKMGERSQNNKVKSFRIYIAIAISSTLITFLIAISNDVPENYKLWVKMITLILSGASTVLAAWDGFFNHKELWANYGDTRNQLDRLLLKMNLTDEDEKLNAKIVEQFYNEYQDVLSSGNSKWKEIRVDEKQSK